LETNENTQFQPLKAPNQLLFLPLEALEITQKQGLNRPNQGLGFEISRCWNLKQR